jgi:hypothetical protein
MPSWPDIDSIQAENNRKHGGVSHMGAESHGGESHWGSCGSESRGGGGYYQKTVGCREP